jgi:hypothetical protein
MGRQLLRLGCYACSLDVQADYEPEWASGTTNEASRNNVRSAEQEGPQRLDSALYSLMGHNNLLPLHGYKSQVQSQYSEKMWAEAEKETGREFLE